MIETDPVGRPRRLASLAGRIIGSAAWTVAGAASLAALPGAERGGGLRSMVGCEPDSIPWLIAAAGAGAAIGILPPILRRLHPGWHRRGAPALPIALGLGILVALIGVRFRDDLGWRVGEGEHRGRSLSADRRLTIWDEERTTQYLRIRDRVRHADAVRYEARVGPLRSLARVSFDVSVAQDERRVMDPETGERRMSDDVDVTVLGLVGGDWQRITTLAVPPWKRWEHATVSAPVGCERIALEASSGAKTGLTYVLLSLGASRVEIGGIPAWLLRFIGTAVVVGALLWLLWLPLSWLLDRAGAAHRSVHDGLPQTPGPRLSRRVLVITSAVIAAAALVASRRATPWLEAATTPVLVKLSPPGATDARLRFGAAEDDEAALVAVAASDLNEYARGITGEVPQTFLVAELPPRLDYRLAISFPDGLPPTVFGGATLIDTKRRRAFASPAAAEWAAESGATTEPRPDGTTVVSAEPGGVLRLRAPVDRTSDESVLGMWIGLTLVGVLTLLLLQVTIRGRWLDRPVLREGYAARRMAVVVAAVLIVALRLGHAHSFSPVYGGDSSLYTMSALAISQDADFTGTHSHKLPGFPTAAGVTYKVAGASFQAVVVMQQLMFGLAVLVAGLVLAAVAPTWVAVACMVACAISPAQLQYARQVHSHSLAAGFSLMAVACIVHLGASGRGRWQLPLFGVFAATAVFIRAASVAVLALPALLWLSGAVRVVLSDAGRMRARLKALVLWSLVFMTPAITVGTALTGWAARNFVQTGFFLPTTHHGQQATFGAICSGTFDPTVLENEAYRGHVTSRVATGWLAANQELKRYLKHERGYPREAYQQHMAGDLYEIAAASQARLPYALRLAQIWRGARAVWRRENDWRGRTNPRRYDSRELVAGREVKQLATVSRRADVTFRETGMRDEWTTSELQELLLGLGPHYYTARNVLWVMAAITSILLLLAGRLVPLLPSICFALTSGIYVAAGGMSSHRYWDTLDMLLVLHLGLAAGALHDWIARPSRESR